MRWSWGCLLLVACGGGNAVQKTCGELCDTLVVDCAYDAYPSRDSCLQGCEWTDEQGGDVEGMRDCVSEAAAAGSCDTFKVIECQHEHGAEADTP